MNSLPTTPLSQSKMERCLGGNPQLTVSSLLGTRGTLRFSQGRVASFWGRPTRTAASGNDVRTARSAMAPGGRVGGPGGWAPVGASGSVRTGTTPSLVLVSSPGSGECTGSGTAQERDPTPCETEDVGWVVPTPASGSDALGEAALEWVRRRSSGAYAVLVAGPFAAIETVLGNRLAKLDEQSIAGLVSNHVREASDLDFKESLYGRSDSDKRDLATDISAMANGAGGVILLGIRDEDGAAVDLTPSSFLRKRSSVSAWSSLRTWRRLLLSTYTELSLPRRMAFTYWRFRLAPGSRMPSSLTKPYGIPGGLVRIRFTCRNPRLQTRIAIDSDWLKSK